MDERASMTADEPEPVRRDREAMARSVLDFAAPAEGWELVMQCAGTCSRRNRLVADLVPQIPAGLTWAEVVPKLRCSQCGGSASIVGLSGPPKTPGTGATWLLLQRGEGKWRSGAGRGN
ncbi:hypothetical protein D9599_19475 [Roseomonas sp. KE2513]|nr:hypothetical protein [Roseomonas sp. KE2513]